MQNNLTVPFEPERGPEAAEEGRTLRNNANPKKQIAKGAAKQGKGKLARLTESQRKTIQAEAAALGINPTEYLTMILTLSKTIRKTLATADSFDAKSVLEWANNPLLTSLLTGLIGSLKKSSETNSQSNTTNSPNSNTTNSNSPHANPSPSPNHPNPPTVNPNMVSPSAPQAQQPVQPQVPLSYDPWYDWM